MSSPRRSAADIDVEQYRIPLDAPDGGEVDPADDLDPADVDRIVAEARGRGRPSLGTPGTHSPVVRLRVTEDVRAELERVATTEGTTTSAVLRTAIDEYLARHPA